jgi:hypothetical protein
VTIAISLALPLDVPGVFFSVAWHIATKNPLRAILAALVIFLSVVAFIIPKFIEVWTIPQLATAVATGAVGADMAGKLLILLNVSIPFPFTRRSTIWAFGCMPYLACSWLGLCMTTI